MLFQSNRTWEKVAVALLMSEKLDLNFLLNCFFIIMCICMIQGGVHAVVFMEGSEHSLVE